jgi:predicted lipoprotein with Yx(FWY)xxD motif
VAVGALAGAALATAGAPAAVPTGTPITTVAADFVAGPFHIQFTGTRAQSGAPDTASGNFMAKAALGSATLFTLAGPVTCLDVVGDQIGLFYAVGQANPEALYAAIHGVYIYVTLTSAGKPSSVNFAPSVSNVAHSCPPLPGLLPISSGTVTVTNGTQAEPATTTLAAATDAATGKPIVVDSSGLSLYELGGETRGHLLCTKGKRCFTAWPPLTVASAKTKLTAAAGIRGKLGILHRNGLFQVTLGGHPLYHFAGDQSKPGAVSGQGIHSFGGTWHTVSAPGATTIPTGPTGSTGPTYPYPYQR